MRGLLLVVVVLLLSGCASYGVVQNEPLPRLLTRVHWRLGDCPCCSQSPGCPLGFEPFRVRREKGRWADEEPRYAPFFAALAGRCSRFSSDGLSRVSGLGRGRPICISTPSLRNDLAGRNGADDPT